MATTMTQIARKAGVSVSTVSRLLRRDPKLRISDERKKLILETARELGGVKGNGRSERTRRLRRLTRTVLLPVNRAFKSDAFLMEFARSPLLQALERQLGISDFQLHLTFFDPGEESAFIADAVKSPQRCDGLVLGPRMVDEASARLLEERQFPHVSNDVRVERFRVNTVGAHILDAFRQVMEHLTELGHERVGYVGPRDTHRYPLYVASMAKMSLRVREEDCCFVEPIKAGASLGQWRAAAHDAAAGWIDAAVRGGVTGLCCSNDHVAFGVMDLMRQRGMRAGREISVVGFDNIEQRGGDIVERPVLTTIDNPSDQVGRRMGELMLNQILHGQVQIVHERIPVQLIVRESTGPAAGRGQ